jgi:hypothetical protein
MRGALSSFGDHPPSLAARPPARNDVHQAGAD